jgi:hypothetical protein
MNIRTKTATVIEYGSDYYPAEHWKRLRRFAVEDERDPRGLFRLTDDKWDLWSYATNGVPSQAGAHRVHFGHFRTFIKLYFKWYCYCKLLESAGNLTTGLQELSYKLGHADSYIGEQGLRSVDEIAPPSAFQALWEAQIKTDIDGEFPLTSRAVTVQAKTRAFWLRIRADFGVPYIIPPTATNIRVKPAAFAVDRSKLIPEHVVRQLSNKLGLHREKKELLRRFEHLRLCVLMLAVCLGRRVNEVLLSPRCAGGDGPLSRLPSKTGAPEGSMWFQFLPNKRGPADKVFISPDWEDIALYCVRTLVRYGDEVRQYAAPEERGQLILVSPLNSTYGICARTWPDEEIITSVQGSDDDEKIEGGTAYKAYGLTSHALRLWLNGTVQVKSVLKSWGITEDGSADGAAYRLLPSYTRHTRHHALTLDTQVSSSALQYDLNHREPDAQFAYQHSLLETNDSLLNKIKEGKLMGSGAEWLSVLLGVENQLPSVQSKLTPGQPSPLDPRMLALIKGNPKFVRLNRVPGGVCVSPQGPGGCAEFLNCTSAAEGGCHCFAVDVDDVQMLHELNGKAAEDRRMQQESAAAGRLVQSQKRETQARRTEDLRDEALRRASEQKLNELRKFRREIEEKGL